MMGDDKLSDTFCKDSLFHVAPFLRLVHQASKFKSHLIARLVKNGVSTPPLIVDASCLYELFSVSFIYGFAHISILNPFITDVALKSFLPVVLRRVVSVQVQPLRMILHHHQFKLNIFLSYPKNIVESSKIITLKKFWLRNGRRLAVQSLKSFLASSTSTEFKFS